MDSRLLARMTDGEGGENDGWDSHIRNSLDSRLLARMTDEEGGENNNMDRS